MTKENVGADLPYPDQETGRSSGWSGGQASADRAHRADLSGETGTLQQRALVALGQRGVWGATGKEMGRILNKPHQSYSSVLSNLHQAGRVARLQQQRKGEEIYVLPDFVRERPTVPFRPNKGRREANALRQRVQRALDKERARGNSFIEIDTVQEALEEG